ncbi:YkgJ family cysteine cluster protein [Blautia sp. XA-2221]|uniref:YkgJ family cysteine cluster protein n=1 Tax=Blautia sp. XA-2221 TaxID=2903961 RepID=UPI002379ABD6|nr:YkgJ family cysteine cluster protein [Blautia sp. XA-2221]
MKRNVTLEEISDGNLYGANDMVKADCQDCKGCSDCCQGMGDTVILDPLDVHRLCEGLKKSPEELLGSVLELGVTDGNILPHLAMKGQEERCVFLNTEGRCSIHDIRPGFCRLFPLGRYYTEDGFKYILQIHECKKKNRSKIKVKKWLDTPDLKQYEKFVLDWHNFLLEVQEVFYDTEDETLVKNLNMYVLSRFYYTPYKEEEDFYPQFYVRLEEAKKLLALGV